MFTTFNNIAASHTRHDSPQDTNPQYGPQQGNQAYTYPPHSHPSHRHRAQPPQHPRKMSGSNPWNDSGFAFAPNTNTLDAQAMPSDKAEAARQKAEEVMRALEDGKPGAADRMMGEREVKGNVGIVPIDWVRSKFSRKGKKEGKDGGKGEKEEKGDGVVR